MELDRREFLTIATAACALTALKDVAMADNATAPAATRVVDAGPAARYAKDGVYGDFSTQGFFVVSKGGRLSAVSSICTHRHKSLVARPDCTLFCKRHGSIFSEDGKVLKGPAKIALPEFASSVDSVTGHLMVTVAVA